MAEFDDTLNSLLSNPNAMSQIMQLAQSLSGGQEQHDPHTSQQTAPQVFPPSPKPTAPSHTSPSGSGDFLSSLAGGIDPSLLLKMMPLIQELGGQQNSNARQLLYALRPYLKPDRQEKIERALQLARLFHVGKKFLAEWGR